MGKFKLKLCIPGDDEIINNLSRKYRALKIGYSGRFPSYMDQKAVKVMQKIASQLRYLELKDSVVSVRDVSLAKAFFESMPQLEDLKVDHFSFEIPDDGLARIEPVNMMKLKLIYISQSSTNVIIAQINKCQFLTHGCHFFSSFSSSRRRKS